MEAKIRDAQGNVKGTVVRLDYTDVWMGECYVMADIQTSERIDFLIGDWLEYRGERFEINYDPEVEKQAEPRTVGNAFVYENVKFNSFSDELTRCDFLDYTVNDNEIHFSGLPSFSFYAETVKDFADRVQANLDRLYKGERKWTVGVASGFDGDTGVNITVEKQKVWNAIADNIGKFGANFIIRGRTLTIGTAGIPADHLFRMGKGNGLKTLTKTAESDQEIVTRLRAYGSTRNLPYRYYHNLPAIDRASAPVYDVTFCKAITGSLGGWQVRFRFQKNYIDTAKCYKSGDRYWFAVWIDGQAYAASVYPPSDEIWLGFTPPKGFPWSCAWLLTEGEATKVVQGATVEFNCNNTLAPGIVKGQFVPNNMAVQRLMLPGFPEATLDPYIDSENIAALGVREGTVFFDGSDDDHPEIYPSIEEMTAQDLLDAGIATTAEGRLDEIVSAQQIEDDGVGTVEGSEVVPDTETFTITLKDVGFDINDYWTDETPMVAFRSGMLGGREFEIVQSGSGKPKQNADKTWTLTLKRVYDEAMQLFFPYDRYNAEAGDRFVLLHIDMPEVYIKAASQRLLRVAEEYLSKNDYARFFYSPEIDETFMAVQHDMAARSNGEIKSLHDTLKAGDLLVFEDTDLGIGGEEGGAAIFIDQLTIKEGEGAIPKYEITLREEKVVGTIQKLQNQIDSIRSGQGGGGYNAAQIKQLIELYGSGRFLSKARADRTPYLLSSDDGFEAGRYVPGVSGAVMGIDSRSGGSFAELDRMTIRQQLTVMELLINQMSVQQGDSLFTEGDTIDTCEPDLSDTATLADGITPVRWWVEIQPRYEGYITGLRPGMVLMGKVNNLFTAATEQTPADYYTVFMRVNGAELGTSGNRLNVTLYDDLQTPAGRNFAPCALMTLARWGHQTEAAYQRLFRLDSHEGYLARYEGVDKPIIDIGNLAMFIGRCPKGAFAHIPGIQEGDEIGYFKTLLGNIIQIDHMGNPVPDIVDAGEYDPTRAYRYRSYDSTERRWVTEKVWYKGCSWLCMADGLTGVTPGYGVTQWAFKEGNPTFSIGFEETAICYTESQIRQFGATLTLTATLYNQDVLSHIPANNITWRRESYDSNGALRAVSDAAWTPTTNSVNKRLLLSFSDLDYDGTPISKISFICTAAIDDVTVAQAAADFS